MKVGAGGTADVEDGEIEFVVDQVVQGVFKGAGKLLPFEIDGEKRGLRAIGL